jgi:hypothetical protein
MIIFAEVQMNNVNGDVGVVSELESKEQGSSVIFSANKGHEDDLSLVNGPLNDCAVMGAVN